MENNKFIENFTPRQQGLLEFVKQCHGDQKRKYTGEPYWHHVVEVAEIVSEYVKTGLVLEIALCHDLFEDTECDRSGLMVALLGFGYGSHEASTIANGVFDLTDEYTKENYPELNRAQRKIKEADRLSTIKPEIQSVKYADLISNTSSIVERDKEFARIYLQEKKAILDAMKDGNVDLRTNCYDIYNRGIEKLSK